MLKRQTEIIILQLICGYTELSFIFPAAEV